MNKTLIAKMVLGAVGAICTIASQAVGDKKEQASEPKKDKE